MIDCGLAERFEWRWGVGSSGFFFSEDNVTANFSISHFQAVSFRLAANTGKLLSQAPPTAVEGNDRRRGWGGGEGRVAGL